jgi:hypothetical protein
VFLYHSITLSIHSTSAALVAFVGCTFTYTIGKMKVLQRTTPLTLLYIATFQLILQGSVPPPHLLRAQNVSDNRSIPDVTLDQLQKVRLLRC